MRHNFGRCWWARSIFGRICHSHSFIPTSWTIHYFFIYFFCRSIQAPGLWLITRKSSWSPKPKIANVISHIESLSEFCTLSYVLSLVLQLRVFVGHSNLGLPLQLFFVMILADLSEKKKQFRNRVEGNASLYREAGISHLVCLIFIQLFTWNVYYETWLEVTGKLITGCLVHKWA